MSVVRIKRLTPEAILPKYRKQGDSGFDLHSTDDVWLCPGQSKLVHTGLAMEVEEGYEIQIRPRSGVSRNTKLRISNTPGTIDSNYRGEVGILVDNISNVEDEIEHITKGMRIAQAVVVPIVRAHIVEVSELSETERMDQGFGSSGSH